MNSVFLYLLGAEASCQALPLSSNFAKRLRSFAVDLKKAGPVTMYGDPNTKPDDPVWGKNRDTLLEAINWLSTESSHHFSVDTFAKKLFFRGDKENLKKLKAALSAFLVIEQSRHPVDQRYDAFLASVLALDENKGIYLPEHLRIFTWNYDTQLEKAFYGFCEDDDKVLKNISINERIYRINGFCGTYPPSIFGDPFYAAIHSNDKPAWEAGINLYNECIAEPSSPDPEIKFAWEDSTNDRLKNVGLSQLSEVSEMVVIGYSFPYFNKEIDQLIFKQFDHLDRIYLQYPKDVHESIKIRLKSFFHRDIEITDITSTDLFHIPDNF